MISLVFNIYVSDRDENVPVVTCDDDSTGAGTHTRLDLVGARDTLLGVDLPELIGKVIVANTAAVDDRIFWQDILLFC